MRFYELLYIARSDLSSAQVEELNNTINNIIQGKTLDKNQSQNVTAGSIVKIHDWGVKNLAYKSKKLKRNKGYCCLIYFNLDDNVILQELNHRLKLNEAILRFMIKQTTNLPTDLQKASGTNSQESSIAS